MSAKTYVLVHGTWHGGWMWRDVSALLRAQGHRVFTPTCTGCGEREHLSAPDVGLDTHITDIMSVIETEELEDIILVGHSFAGVTITGVADRMRDRIKQIVFFDALVPRPGRMSGVERDPETGAFPDSWFERRKKFIDGYKMEFWAEYPIKMLVPETETEVIARLKRLITTHPAKQWEDVLELENGGWEGLSPAYIHCVGQAFAMSSEKMVGPARGPGWRYIPADIPRNGMLTHPEAARDLLLEFG
ncbi:MAG: alpha/beta fold hydrolase [Pseudomonadota bacterium]